MSHLKWVNLAVYSAGERNVENQVHDGNKTFNFIWVNLAVTAAGNMLKGKAQDGTSKSHFKRVKLAISAEGNKC